MNRISKNFLFAAEMFFDCAILSRLWRDCDNRIGLIMFAFFVLTRRIKYFFFRS